MSNKIVEPMAFGVIERCQDATGWYEHQSVKHGLTKREYFAAMALQGFISSLTIGRGEFIPLVTETAVKYADALIEELNKEKK